MSLAATLLGPLAFVVMVGATLWRARSRQHAAQAPMVDAARTLAHHLGGTLTELDDLVITAHVGGLPVRVHIRPSSGFTSVAFSVPPSIGPCVVSTVRVRGRELADYASQGLIWLHAEGAEVCVPSPGAAAAAEALPDHLHTVMHETRMPWLTLTTAAVVWSGGRVPRVPEERARWSEDAEQWAQMVRQLAASAVQTP